MEICLGALDANSMLGIIWREPQVLVGLDLRVLLDFIDVIFFILDVEDGALLPSPTREKLMPTLPRSKTGSPQRGSPQKTIGSRHGSPLKTGSPQKSPKKITKGKIFKNYKVC